MEEIVGDGCWSKCRHWVNGRLVFASQLDLKDVRDKHGLTQSYCADMCHVSTRTWQKYEREGAPIWLRELFALKLMVR